MVENKNKDSISSKIKEIRHLINGMTDDFYSFKSDIDQRVTELYGILNELQNRIEKEND